MPGLIPVDGGGGPPLPTCFRCGDPASGPCAMCRVLICTADECGTIVEEPGLRDVVLCSDCIETRPPGASQAWAAPAVAALGVGSLWLLSRVSGDSILWALAYLVAGTLVVLALAAAIMRWQWRTRLRRARGDGPAR